MLKTRPRVLLGVIFPSVNIVGLSDQSSHSHSSTQLSSPAISHYLPLVNLFTEATTYLCPLAPVFINHHHTAFLSTNKTQEKILLYLKKKYFFDCKIDWLFLSGAKLVNL